MSSENADSESDEKTCFVIMPISASEGYDSDHFKRVYEHLIKPACTEAGFTPMRADDVKQTNYIVIDILRRILESELVLCDLSSHNPNVLYELGLRQAFNLPVVLIRDETTDRIFDIQGLRYVEYDSRLRVDVVQREAEKLATALKETAEADEDEVNSVVQLLGVQPASVPHPVEISGESSLILDAVRDISERMSRLEDTVSADLLAQRAASSRVQMEANLNGTEVEVGDNVFIRGDKIGTFMAKVGEDIIVENLEGDIEIISPADPRHGKIDTLPF